MGRNIELFLVLPPIWNCFPFRNSFSVPVLSERLFLIYLQADRVSLNKIKIIYFNTILHAYNPSINMGSLLFIAKY